MTTPTEAMKVIEMANRTGDDADLAYRAVMFRRVAEATLLFHSGGPWTVARSDRWNELTGEVDATTKTLCDFARRVYAELDAELPECLKQS